MRNKSLSSFRCFEAELHFERIFLSAWATSTQNSFSTDKNLIIRLENFNRKTFFAASAAAARIAHKKMCERATKAKEGGEA